MTIINARLRLLVHSGGPDSEPKPNTIRGLYDTELNIFTCIRGARGARQVVYTDAAKMLVTEDFETPPLLVLGEGVVYQRGDIRVEPDSNGKLLVTSRGGWTGEPRSEQVSPGFTIELNSQGPRGIKKEALLFELPV